MYFLLTWQDEILRRNEVQRHEISRELRLHTIECSLSRLQKYHSVKNCNRNRWCLIAGNIILRLSGRNKSFGGRYLQETMSNLPGQQEQIKHCDSTGRYPSRLSNLPVARKTRCKSFTAQLAHGGLWRSEQTAAAKFKPHQRAVSGSQRSFCVTWCRFARA